MGCRVDVYPRPERTRRDGAARKFEVAKNRDPETLSMTSGETRSQKSRHFTPFILTGGVTSTVDSSHSVSQSVAVSGERLFDDRSQNNNNDDTWVEERVWG